MVIVVVINYRSINYYKRFVMFPESLQARLQEGLQIAAMLEGVKMLQCTAPVKQMLFSILYSASISALSRDSGISLRDYIIGLTDDADIKTVLAFLYDAVVDSAAVSVEEIKIR